MNKREYTAAEINMMVKTARPINVEPISETEFINKYADRVRHGKTKKDHKRKGHAS